MSGNPKQSTSFENASCGSDHSMCGLWLLLSQSLSVFSIPGMCAMEIQIFWLVAKFRINRAMWSHKGWSIPLSPAFLTYDIAMVLSDRMRRW